MADELTRLKPGKQIACVAGLPPILLRKAPYWTQAELRGRYHRNPYFNGKTSSNAGGELAAIWARIYYALVCLMAPHPAVAAAVSIIVILGALSWISS